jgi:hypothetical protein
VPEGRGGLKNENENVNEYARDMRPY